MSLLNLRSLNLGLKPFDCLRLGRYQGVRISRPKTNLGNCALPASYVMHRGLAVGSDIVVC
jgi:hypothetical protein